MKGGSKKPSQLELAGTITSAQVAGAFARTNRRKRNRGDSAEGDFGVHVRAHRLPPIQRKYLFAKRALGRKWEADYAYPEYGLLIEIDGGVWRRGGGAHSHPTQILRDMEKGNDAALLRYHVLRFTTDQVANGEAIAYLQRVLHERGWCREAGARDGPGSRSAREGVVAGRMVDDGRHDPNGGVVLREHAREVRRSRA